MIAALQSFPTHATRPGRDILWQTNAHIRHRSSRTCIDSDVTNFFIRLDLFEAYFFLLKSNLLVSPSPLQVSTFKFAVCGTYI